jgi:hypothetical protein
MFQPDRVMMSVFRPFVAAVTAVAFVASTFATLPAAPAIAQTSAPVSIQSCRALSDEQLRAEIQTISATVIRAELGQINYAAIVDRYWRATAMDRRIDERVDAAIVRVRADTTWLDRAYSTISQERATALATAVAERTYQSEQFQGAMAELIDSIGQDVGARMEQAAAQSSGPAIACMQLALESRYGSALAQSFESQRGRALSAAASAGGTRIESTDLLLEGTQSIAGILLIMSRRMVSQLVSQMARRLAGAIVTRIVSSLTLVVGLALIAKDVYEAGEGIFPLVEERMKSAESKQLVKTEIASAVSGYVVGNLDVIAQDTAVRMFAVWEDFKRLHDVLLALADSYPRFAEFLRQVQPGQIAPLGEIVQIIIAGQGEAGIVARLEDGSLQQALGVLGPAGLTIARQTRSIDTALAWQTLAGERLGDVVRFDLYSRLKPDQITRTQLERLLALGDAAAISRLAALAAPVRDQLLALQPAQVRELASQLSERELLALSRYETELPPLTARRLLQAVAEQPQRMKPLTNFGVQDAVLTSRDQAAAIDMLLDPGGYFSLFDMVNDFSKLREGDVKARVFIEAYMSTVAVSFVLVLILLGLLLRMFRGRRTTVIVKSEDGKIIGRGKG